VLDETASAIHQCFKEAVATVLTITNMFFWAWSRVSQAQKIA